MWPKKYQVMSKYVIFNVMIIKLKLHLLNYKCVDIIHLKCIKLASFEGPQCPVGSVGLASHHML